MAKNTQLTNLAVNTEADAFSVLFNGGFLDLFDGAQPATGDTAITTQNMLASITFNATAFASAANGVITANPMTACSAATLTGNATWARCYESNHTTALMDVSVGTANTNVVLNSVAIQANAQVSVSSFTFTVAKSTAGV
jgi:hypothetical protein